MSESIALPTPEEPDRKCVRCEITKPADAFHRRGSGKRRPMCGPCRAEMRPQRVGWKWSGIDTPADKRARHLRRKYGITMDQYAQMLAAQGGGCAICHAPPPTTRSLAVDHCHATGVVRALLCGTCNRSLGYYEYIRGNAETYLAKYGRGNSLLGYSAD